MSNIKYKYILTKELLINEYNSLNNISAISRKFNIPAKTLIIYFNKFNINYKKKNRYNYNKDFFKANNEFSFYIAGFIAADGCINGNAIDIILSSKDSSILEKIAFHISDMKPYVKTTNNYQRVVFKATCPEMVKDLKRFNITSNKSLTYTPPVELINNKYISHFIRGYVDGDGCWTKNKNQIVFKLLGTKKFLKFVLDIFEVNGICCKNKTIQKRDNIYCIEFGGNLITQKIYNIIYKDATLYLERKRNKASQCFDLTSKR